jgi:hypothetical protein
MTGKFLKFAIAGGGSASRLDSRDKTGGFQDTRWFP